MSYVNILVEIYFSNNLVLNNLHSLTKSFHFTEAKKLFLNFEIKGKILGILSHDSIFKRVLKSSFQISLC